MKTTQVIDRRRQLCELIEASTAPSLYAVFTAKTHPCEASELVALVGCAEGDEKIRADYDASRFDLFRIR